MDCGKTLSILLILSIFPALLYALDYDYAGYSSFNKIVNRDLHGGLSYVSTVSTTSATQGTGASVGTTTSLAVPGSLKLPAAKDVYAGSEILLDLGVNGSGDLVIFPVNATIGVDLLYLGMSCECGSPDGFYVTDISRMVPAAVPYPDVRTLRMGGREYALWSLEENLSGSTAVYSIYHPDLSCENCSIKLGFPQAGMYGLGFSFGGHTSYVSFNASSPDIGLTGSPETSSTTSTLTPGIPVPTTLTQRGGLVGNEAGEVDNISGESAEEIVVKSGDVARNASVDVNRFIRLDVDQDSMKVGGLVLGRPLDLVWNYTVTNELDGFIDASVELPIPAGVSDVRVYGVGGFFTNSSDMNLYMRPEETLNLSARFRANPVVLTIENFSKTPISELLPKDAFNPRIYVVETSNNDVRLVLANNSALDSEVSFRKLSITHNSTFTYRNVSFDLELPGDEYLIDPSNEHIFKTCCGFMQDGKLRVEFEELGNKTMLSGRGLKLVQEKAVVGEPVRWVFRIENTSVEYETPAPLKAENVEINPNGGWKKTVKVESDASVHYRDVTVSVDVNASNEYDLRVYHLVNGSRIEITHDPRYVVSFLWNETLASVTKVEWIVPMLSAESFEIEADITILNVQSYPVVGGNWTVMFNTTGTSDLVIKAVNETTWSDSTENEDLKLLEILCGETRIDYEWINDSVYIANYSCYETGFETSKVLTIGKHDLEFSFGGKVAYAHNTAGACTGSPASCSTRSQTYCSTCGCTWNTASCTGTCTCTGVSLTYCECDSVGGGGAGHCYWLGSPFNACQGGGACSCSDASTQTCCQAHACSWNAAVCSGSTPHSCSYYTSSTSCTNCGCTWLYADGDSCTSDGQCNSGKCDLTDIDKCFTCTSCSGVTRCSNQESNECDAKCTGASSSCDDKTVDSTWNYGDTAGCGNDNTASNCNDCVYATLDCDASDVCSNVCDGAVVKAYKDYYVSSGFACTYSYGSTVEDCSTKTTSDSDGRYAYTTGGYIYDYTSCSSGSCTYDTYHDYCSGETVYDYYASTSTYGTDSYDCNGYDTCVSGQVTFRDYTCVDTTDDYCGYTDRDRDDASGYCTTASGDCDAQTWIASLGAGGNACCGNDGSSDDWSTYSGTLTSSTSLSCHRCLDGVSQGQQTYYGNGYLSGSGTSRTCYYGDITCSSASGANGDSSTVYGWGWYDGNLATSTSLSCRSGAATCSDGSASSDSISTLYGNGYLSGSGTSRTCYYGDITCSDGSESSGDSSTVYGWGWYSGDLASDTTVDCRSGAATCSDGSASSDSISTLCGNGYFSSSSSSCSSADKTSAESGYCFYGDIACSDGSESKGSVSGALYGNGYWTGTTCYYGDIACSDGSSGNGDSGATMCSSGTGQCCTDQGHRAEGVACNDGSIGGTSYDRDTSEARCTDDSSPGCTGYYWAIGGEINGSACCEDDSGEYRTTSVCDSACTTNASDDACCAADSKCVYSSTCYDSGAAANVGGDAENDYCSSGTWYDCPSDDVAGDAYCSSDKHCEGLGSCQNDYSEGAACGRDGQCAAASSSGSCDLDDDGAGNFCGCLSGTECLDDGACYAEDTMRDYDGDATEEKCIAGSWSEDSEPPVISLETLEDSGDNDGNVTLEYNVSDTSDIENCSLIFDGLVNDTNYSVSKGETQYFSLTDLPVGSYSWSVNCTDSMGYQGNSTTGTFYVVYTTEYSGDTTDLSGVNVSDIVGLTLHKPDTGKIVYNESVNLSGGVNLNTLTDISSNNVSVDSSSEPRLNRSATLYLYGLSYLETPVIYRDASFCSDCTVNSYLGGNLSFNVTGFTSYTTGENANLTIWDETDAEGGGETKYIDQQVVFYANYTNKTSGSSVNGSGVYCNITFNVSGSWEGWQNMSFNATSLLYEYNRSFDTNGTFDWKVSCNGSALGYEPLQVMDNVTVSEQSVHFTVTLNSPENQSTAYDSTPDFNYTVIGSESSYSCTLYINDTAYGLNSSTLNNTVSNITANATLSDGAYSWYVNCTSGDTTNQSEIRSLTVDAVSPFYISNCTDFSMPGTYYLNGNIRNSTVKYCMNLSVNNVTLDCQGNMIDGIDSAGTYGVYINRSSGQTTNATLRNCVLMDWYWGVYVKSAYANTLSNVTANSNMEYGVYLDTSFYNNITDVVANSNLKHGMYLVHVLSNNISGITANGNSQYGLFFDYYGSNIISNAVLDSNSHGIHVDQSDSNNFTNISVTDNTYGVYMVNADLNTFLNLTATQNSNSGVYLMFSTGNNLTNISSTSNVYGLSLDSSSSNVVSNAALQENNYYDFFISATSDSYCDNTFTNITGSNNLPIEYYNNQATIGNKELSGLILCDADNSVVSNVTITGSASKDNNGLLIVQTSGSNISDIVSSNNYYGIKFDYSSNNSLYDVTADSCFRGVFLSNSDSNNLSNISSSYDNSYGVSLSYSDSNRLSEINSGYCNVEIFITRSHNNTITNVTAISSPNGEGIKLDFSNSNNISNVVANSNENGIYIYYSSSNTISNVTSNSNTQKGVYFYRSSNNNLSNISANSNTEYGIRIYMNSDSNVITDSTVSGSGIAGVFLDESSTDDPEYNLVYNTLLNNSVNVVVDDNISNVNFLNSTNQTGTRIFGSGTRIGGNYYTNSTGDGYSDTCDDNDTDGFCDEALNLSVGVSVAFDYLPLSDGYVESVFTITLDSPGNGSETPDPTPDFNYTVAGTKSTYSCTLYLNDTAYGMNASTLNNTASNITANDTLSDGIYDWYVNCTAMSVTNTSEMRVLTVDTSISIDCCHDLNVSGGVYYLTANISNSEDTHCMNISANNVILDCQGNRIDGKDTSNTYGVYIHRSTEQTTNVTLRNCVISDWYDGVYVYKSDSNTLQDITLNSNTFDGLLLESSDSNNVSNVSSGSNNYGIRIVLSANFNNLSNITANSNQYGFYLASSDSNTFTNITASFNTNRGFDLESSDSNILSGITANSNTQYGILLYRSDSNDLSGLITNSNGYIGLQVGESVSNSFSNSTAQENTKYDVYVSPSSDSECSNTFTNITCSNDLPLGYYDSQALIENKTLSELILCNADGSVVNNVSINGSQAKDNNGFFVLRTSGSNINDIVSSDNYVGFHISDSDSNNYSNVTVNSSAENGFYIIDSESSTFSDITLTSNGNDGLRIFTSLLNTFSDITASSNTARGFYYSGSSSNFSNVTANSNGVDGFYVSESTSNAFSNITVQENNQHDLYVYASLDSSCDNSFIDITGSNNLPIEYYNSSSLNLENKTLSGLLLCNADNSSLDNITINASQAKDNNGVFVLRTSGSNLSNIVSSDNYFGIFLRNSGSNNLLNITANSNAYYGLFIASESDTNVLTNITSDSNGYYGLYISSSSSNNLSEINAGLNSKYGFYLLSSDSNDIRDSTANSNLLNGFHVRDSDSNNLSNVSAESNLNYGVTMYLDSDSNVIADSTISGSGIAGIFFDESSTNDPEYNQVYNTLFNNTLNIKSDDNIANPNYFNSTNRTGARIFGGGTNIGGNYYTNSSGSGYSDTCDDNDTDGFCDEALNISVGVSVAFDYLPLSDGYVGPAFTVSLDSPGNQSATSDSTPDFNYTVTGSKSTYSCTLYLNDTAYGTNTSTLNDTVSSITANDTLSDGIYDWYVNCTSEDTTNQSGRRSLTVDTTSPVFSYNNQTPDNDSYINVNNTEINLSINEVYLDSFKFDWNGSNYSIYDDSLVLCLNFENNSLIGENSTYVVDSSKYGNNGTVYNLDWTSSGRFGGGLEFDYDSSDGYDYINLGNRPTLYLSGMSGYTMMAWVRLNSKEDDHTILSIDHYGIIKYDVGEDSWFAIAEGPTEYSIKYAKYLQSNPQLDTWTFVVGRWNGTQLSVWVDGIKGSVVAGIASLYNRTGETDFVGCEWAVNSRNWNGTIDEVRIYNRSLSDDEIRMHYQSEFKKYNPTSYGFYVNVTNLSDGSYDYYGWANDTAGNSGSSAVRTLTVDTIYPSINFTNPTLLSNESTGNDFLYVNVSVNDSNNMTAFIDFNHSLVGWWRFNDESGENSTFVIDWSGYVNNGAILDYNESNSDGDRPAQWVSRAKFGGGYLFDGFDDYINIGNPSSLNITGAVTLETWVILSGATEYDHYLISKRGYNLFISGSTIVARFSVRNLDDSGWTVATSNQTLEYGRLYHLAGVYSQSEQKLRVYIDGEEKANQTYDQGLILFQPQSVYLGRYAAGPQYLNGTLDEVRIWNRALSAEEINASYNAGLNLLYANYTNLSDGYYNYTAYVQDQAGNVNSTTVLNVLVDTSNPTVSFDASTTAGGYTSNDYIFINVTASNGNRDTVLLEWNGVNESFENSSGNVFWENKTGLSDGSYSFKAFVNDSANNWGNTSLRTVTVHLNPVLSYNNQTPDNDSYINVNSSEVNLSIDEPHLDEYYFDLEYTEMDDYLVGWWRFNNETDFADYSVYGNDGTNHGSNYTVDGKKGGARAFDGVDDYVSCGTDSSLDIADEITIEAWVKFDGTAQGSFVLKVYGDPFWNGYQFECYNASALRLRTFDGGYANKNQLIADMSIIPGEWYHVVGALSHTNNVSYIYVNGVELNNGAAPYEIGLNELILQIGQLSWQTGLSFNGSIDEVRIYNTSLTAEQVAARYHSTRGRFFDDSLVMALNFDNDSDIGENETHAVDISGYGNNGTVRGSALKFDGTNDYVNVSNNPSLNLSTVFSVDAWVYSGGYHNMGSNWNSILCKNSLGDGSPQPYFGLFITASEKVYFIVNDDSFAAVSTTSIKGAWHHIVGVRNETSLEIYVDGLLEGSDTTENSSSNDDPLLIGQDGSGIRYFNGTVDEVRIYNRSMSADEVREHYFGNYSNKTGLVLYIPFSNLSGTIATDYSGHGNHGNLTNFADTSAEYGDTHDSGWTSYGRPLYTTDGKFGGAYTFNGLDDYVDCGNDSSLDITGAITVMGWVKCNNPSIYQTVINKGWNNAGGWSIQLTEDGGHVEWNIKNQSLGYFTTSSQTTISGSVWYHVAGTWDSWQSSDQLKLYVNGNLEATDNTSGVIGNAANVRLGHTLTRYMNGSIDAVRIYNRSLTADEIWMHYQSEFKKYNSTVYGFYVNLTNLSDGSYEYYGWANDTVANSGVSVTRTLEVDTIFPSINLTSPTLLSNESTGNDFLYVNVSVNDSNDMTAFIDFNRSLVGWWRFNGVDDFIDYSSYGNNGTNYGSNYTTAGRFGGARSFDGVADYVDCGNDSSLDILYAITTEAWIKIDGATGDNQVIGRKEASYNIPRVYEDYGSFRFIIWINGSWEDIYYYRDISAIENEWHHIVGTYDGSYMRIYFDGAEVESKEQTGNLSVSSHPFSIGRVTTQSWTSFNGTIDEVRIWNRALSAEEINASYNAGLNRLYANYTNLSEGYYNYTAYVQDQAGNVNSTTALNVLVDTSNPTVSFDSSTSAEGYTSNDYVFINVTASNGNRDTVLLEWNGVNESFDNNESNVFWENKTGLSDGVYSFRVYVNDSAGNWGNTSLRAVTVHLDPVLDYTGQTRDNGSVVNVNYTEVNMTIDEPHLDEFYFDLEYTDADDHLVGWWRFNNDSSYGENDTHVFDYSGNGNNGTVYDDTNGSIARYVSGKKGLGLEFDGADDYVDCGSESSLNLTASLTVEAWVKPLNNTGIRSIAGKSNSNAQSGYWVLLDYSELKFAGYLYGLDDTYPTGASNHNFTVGQWNHVVLTYDGSYITTYVNGARDLQDDSSGTVNLSARDFRIGREEGYAFNGTIDEVRVYNTSMTAQQVAARYHSTRGRYFDDSLVLALNFDNDSDIGENLTYAVDISKYGNNGTVRGSALKLDGVNDVVKCGNDPSLDITDEISIEAWFYAVNFSGTYPGIVNKYYSSATTGGYLLSPALSTDYKLGFWLRYNDSSFEWIGSDSPISLNSWHHVVASRNEDNLMRMWIDGILQADNETYSMPASPSTKNLTLGYYNGFFNGTVDEVRIYNRSLTADEVAEHYNGNYSNESGLVLYLPFANRSGMEATDYSGLGNHGNLTNFANTSSGYGDAHDSGWTNYGRPLYTTNGRFGGAYSFNGIDDYVDCGTDESLDVTGDELTLESWIYLNALPCYAGYWNAKEGQYRLRVSDVGVFEFRTNANGDWTNSYVTTGTGAVSIGRWYHLAGVYDGSTMKVYIDGIEQNSKNITGNIGTSANSLVHGVYYSGATNPRYFLNGSIDSVRIYNRSLTPDEIWMHYQSEFKRYNSTTYGFYTNLTNLSDGVYEFYGWANDSSGNSGLSDVRVLNVSAAPSYPLVSNVSVGDSDGGNVELSVADDTIVYCNATLSDGNGWIDIVSANATLYHSSSNSSAVDDKNQHYTNSSCTLFDGSGTERNASCAFVLEHEALSGTWTCNITGFDSSASGSGSGNATMDQLVAMSILEDSIDFGLLGINENSSSAESVNVSNEGNMGIDVRVQGDDMSCSGSGSIGAGNISYSVSDGDYDSMSSNKLSAGMVTVSGFNLGVEGVATGEDVNSTKLLYWTMKVPPVVFGDCNNTVTVTAIIDEDSMDSYFVVQNDSGSNVATFSEAGSIILLGSCISGGSCASPPDGSFVVENASNVSVAYVDMDGNLCIQDGDCDDYDSDCSSAPDASFIVENDLGQGVLYIDSTGNLCMEGELTENGSP